MSKQRELYIVRHGETLWSKTGQHTGLTDIPLTENGEDQAKRLGKRLLNFSFDHVFVSPLKRALDTCTLCGLKEKAKVTNALLEWDYGDYEGKTTAEIRQNDPDWSVFESGCPNGESVESVKKRADDFIENLSRLKGNIVLFSSGHFSRVLATRFLKLPISNACHFILTTASLSILSYEHQNPVFKLWNDVSHHSQ